MKLIEGVYFYDCGEYVYLRNVNDTKEYLFNPIGYDILKCIEDHPGCDEAFVCRNLLEIYEVEDPEALAEDVQMFIRELEQNQLIALDAKEAEPKPDISEMVDELCRKEGRIHSATLELTYRCNERCIHCYVDDGCDPAAPKELSLAEYRKLLDQLKEMGCIHLLLTGGEVCLRKDFLEIAQYAVSSGFLVDVYTNGIGLTDEHFDRLCAMKVNSVSFSLYSADPAVHDGITKVPGSFERTLKRLMMFKCAGIDTYVKTVVIQQNLDSLEGLLELGRRLRIPVNPATSISDTHTGASKAACRLEDQSQRLRAAQILQKYDPVPLQQLSRDVNSTICRAGISTLSVDPYGGVHPCLAFTQPVGSIREQSLREIWENAPLMKKLRNFRFRELSEKCGSCQFSAACGVCIGAAYSESGGKLCPNSDSCQWAEASYNAASVNL